jgi:ClpA/ClpB-like protein
MNSASSPRLQALAEKLGPYTRHSLERAAVLAAKLHAEEVSPEHLLATLLEDESCAATRVVLHAFADPDTIRVEVMALCAGIMVVGSGQSLPFSVGAVRALDAARAIAAARSASQVRPAEVFLSAEEELPGPVRSRLASILAGSLERSAGGGEESPAETGPVPAEGPLFRHFSPRALRALGSACRAAASLGREAIGPVHLLIGCLEADEELRARTGLDSARVRMVLSGVDADETPLPARSLEADERLHELLNGLASGAETVDILGWLLTHGPEELVALLRRQKITPALFERCRGAYHDPSPPTV